MTAPQRLQPGSRVRDWSGDEVEAVLTADDIKYRCDIDHCFWIEVNAEVLKATVWQDVLPGEHTVFPIDGPAKHFTDLDEAIAWAKNHILDTADQARKEQP